MFSKKDDDGIAIVLAIIAMIFVAIAVAVYIFACILAAIFTILSLLAFNRPLHLWGGHVVQPKEARIFLASGAIGSIAVPLAAAFCAALAGNTIPDEWWFYLVTGGYAFVAIGVATCLEEDSGETASPIDALVIDHEPPRLPHLAPLPFEYASWNDDEARK